MSDNSPFETNHVCFPLPDGGLSTTAFKESRLTEPPPSKALIENRVTADGPPDDLLYGLTTRGAEALSRFVPTLMCGEESAVHVFQKEARRADAIGRAASGSLLAQIAAEEVKHEMLLGLLRSRLPVSDDLATLRRRARFFFFRLASRDPLIHFARIVGLDGGVCITLSSLLHPSGALAKAPRISQIWRRIWLDEARHVRISRRHVVDLGIAQTRLMEEGLQVRASLADLLRPLGDDFENMGVDPDRLFRRVAGSEEDGAGAVSTR